MSVSSSSEGAYDEEPGTALGGSRHGAVVGQPRFVQLELGSRSPDLDLVNNRVSLLLNAPPSCAEAAATPALLWPPNHRLVDIEIMGLSDADGELTLDITAVHQDEPVSGRGDGNTSPDAVFGDGALQLRAERGGPGDGRVYHVDITARDTLGASCQATVTVCVPHDGSGRGCIDQGPLVPSAP